jgi:hypothetical protein
MPWGRNRFGMFGEHEASMTVVGVMEGEWVTGPIEMRACKANRAFGSYSE